MEHPKKELIEGIADLFEDHEEVYVPGEWEAFKKQRERRKYPFLAQWIKIAAVLFLILSILVFSLTTRVQDSAEIVSRKGKVEQPANGTGVSSGIDALPGDTVDPVDQKSVAENSSALGELLAPASLSAKNNSLPSIGLQEDPQVMAQAVLDPLALTVKSSLQAASNITTANLKKEEIEDTIPLHKNETLSTIDFLIAESKKPNTEQKKKETGSKWDFGMEVMPTVTQKNMNVGAGLTTAYRLSDKLSISSGISLLQLQSGVDVGGRTGGIDMSVARALSDRELTAVNANIKAIDIPLGLVYKINKHFYTSAGVSYFNVINEKRSNTYVQTAQISQSVSNALTGASYSYKAVASEQVSEAVPDEPLRGNSYLGFFNFSVGRKQTLFNKYNIRIEPFIKVPVGKLSDQELKLMNSGLKLQLSF